MSQAVVVVTKRLPPTSFFVCSLSFYALFMMLMVEVRPLSPSLEHFQGCVYTQLQKCVIVHFPPSYPEGNCFD